MYKTFVRPILFLGDAEAIHSSVIGLGRLASLPWLQSLWKPIVESAYGFEDPALRTRVFGLEFQNPIGLAAGFDKNAHLVSVLPALGFGFVEVGTVTPQPQPGNPKPRLFRLTQDEAIVNRLGFNGDGMAAVRARLENARRSRPAAGSVVIGVNIGKNKTTPNERARSDYEACFQELSSRADYVAVNVSSPNTPHLRELQGREALRALLGRIQELNAAKEQPLPVLLKISPDLTEAQLDDVIVIATETRIGGIIAANTTVARSGLSTPASRIASVGDGGLSGKPLSSRSNELIRSIFRKTTGALPIVGVGGVFSAEDAYEKIRAGASLIQLYTGLVYEGPGVVSKIKRGLAERLQRDGLASIRDAVGLSAR